MPFNVKLVVTGILILAAVRGLLSYWSYNFIFTDGTIYATVAKNIAAGNGLQYCGAPELFYPPGYSIAIAVFYLLFQNVEFAGHFVSFLSYFGTVFVISKLSWRIYPSTFFTCSSTFLAALHPTLVYFSSYVMPESLLTFVIVLSSYLCWSVSERQQNFWIPLLFIGLLDGYAYLIRADGILYYPLHFFFILFTCRNQLQKVVFPMTVSLLLWLLCILSYVLFLYDHTGTWQLSTKTGILLSYSEITTQIDNQTTQQEELLKLDETNQNMTLGHHQHSLLVYAINKPMVLFNRIIHNLINTVQLSRLTFGWIGLTVLFILGIYYKGSWFSKSSLFIFIHIIPFAFFLLFYIDIRFLMPFIPYFLLITGLFLSTFVPKLYVLWIKQRVIFSLIILLLFFSVIVLIQSKFKHRIETEINMITNPSKFLPLEHQKLGEWMSGNETINQNITIAHTKPWVSFYAGGCHVLMPYFSREEQIETWLSSNTVNFVVIDERITSRSFPFTYDYFLNDKSEMYELIYETRHEGFGIQLYKRVE